LCQRALQALDGWRNRGLEYPPYLAYLTLFVLAVGRPGDHASHSYYPRLRELLDEPGDGAPPSFNRMLDLWDDLEKWTIQDKGGALGLFEGRILGGWIHVGLPLAQTILTDKEQRNLPDVFFAAGLDPAATPTSEALVQALMNSGSGRLRARTLRALQPDADRG